MHSTHSSGSGLEAGSPPAYAAAKAVLISHSKTLAVALAPQKIRVNVIAPGSIEFDGGLWDTFRHSNPELLHHGAWNYSVGPPSRRSKKFVAT